MKAALMAGAFGSRLQRAPFTVSSLSRRSPARPAPSAGLRSFGLPRALDKVVKQPRNRWIAAIPMDIARVVVMTGSIHEARARVLVRMFRDRTGARRKEAS